MDISSIVIGFLSGSALCFGIGYIVHRSKLKEQEAKIQSKNSVEIATLTERIKALDEKNSELSSLESRFSDAFKALSHDALKSNNESFIALARTQFEKLQQTAQGELDKKKTSMDELVKPIRDSLLKVDVKLEELERFRIEAHTSLVEQMKSLSETNVLLRSETDNLVQALRRPSARGRWGEIQLKRVVEMSGMLEYCDFVEQENVSVEGKNLRPDMIIKLPSERNIVVDSKVPLEAFLAALEAKTEDEKENKLRDHARQIKQLIIGLSSKSYWEHVKPAPEFAVLFIPGESFFGAALERDPELIEFAASRNVIIATPSTLIALLRAVAYGWRQDKMARNAEQVSKLGKELHDRLMTFVGYFADMKRGLDTVTNSYNKAVSSLESRVIVTARKFKELGVDSPEELPPPTTVEVTAKTIEITAINE